MTRLQFQRKGISQIQDSSGLSLSAKIPQDGITPPNNPLAVTTYSQLYNGVNYDVQRNNMQGTLLASATRTAGGYSPVLTNYNGRGVILTVNITAITGTSPGLSLQIVDGSGYAYSPGSNVITATGSVKMVLYPGSNTAPVSSMGNYSLPLSRSWGVYYNITGTSPSITFSVNYDVIL